MYHNEGKLNVSLAAVKLLVEQDLGEYYRREISRQLFGRHLCKPLHGYHITIANFEKYDKIDQSELRILAADNGKMIRFDYSGVVLENMERDGSGIYYYLEVQSPIFSIIRDRLGLPPLRHAFHLTVGYYAINNNAVKTHSAAAMKRKRKEWHG